METSQYLTFILSGQEYGIDALKVIEVINPVSVTNVPMAPPTILGVMNFRGDVIPLIDFSRLLTADTSSASGKIIVVSHNDAMYGIQVDMVREIIVPDSFIEASQLGEVKLPHLKAVTQTQLGLVRLIDIGSAVESLA